LAQDAARLQGDAARLEPHPDAQSTIDAAKAAFIEAMDDDFNTPKAIGALFELVTEAHKYKGRPGADYMIPQAANAIQQLCKDILGVDAGVRHVHRDIEIPYNIEGPLIKKTIDELLEERQAARKNKDFKRSDEIRVLLKEKGIIVEDTPQGQQWRKE
jgi:cysteinyl-tRNA synthetase